jgi:RimJ/RimL family protein N-acetyltransferase
VTARTDDTRTDGVENVLDDHSWEAFVAALRQLVPLLDGVDLHPDLRLEQMFTEDRVAKGVILAAMRHLLLDPPPGMIAHDRSLGELHEWRNIRAPDRGDHTRSSAVEPRHDRSLETNAVRLRVIRDSDVPALYQSATDPRWSHRWRYRGATPSIQDFVDQLGQGVLAQFIVERKEDGSPAGLVTSYNARLDIGSCYIAFARISKSPTAGGPDMLEGGFLFVNFLFRNWPLRKLYAEVPGWNWPQFQSGSGHFFEVEGTLRDHEYFDGRYWDQYIVGLHRERWFAQSGVMHELYPHDG